MGTGYTNTFSARTCSAWLSVGNGHHGAAWLPCTGKAEEHITQAGRRAGMQAEAIPQVLLLLLSLRASAVALGHQVEVHFPCLASALRKGCSADGARRSRARGKQVCLPGKTTMRKPHKQAGQLAGSLLTRTRTNSALFTIFHSTT